MRLSVNKTNFKYTGQEKDPETGLYNYGARLYDPGSGMFTTPDTIVPNFADPQSLNRFSYALNNPMRYTDPTGHYSWDEFKSDVGSAYNYVSSSISRGLSYLAGGSGSAGSYSGGTGMTTTGGAGATADTYSQPANDGGGTNSPSLLTYVSNFIFGTDGYAQSNPRVPISTEDVGNILFNETRSLSGEGIYDARVNLAHSIFNADDKWGADRNLYAGSAPTTVKVPSTELEVYGQCQVCSLAASYQHAAGIDPTNNATNFNFRNNNSVVPFQNLPVKTHIGPFNNSFPSSALNATGIYSNTYGK